MTKGRESESKSHFTLAWLPWLLGAAALICYTFTLNRSLSFLPDWLGLMGSPPAGARSAGWSWQPELMAPAYYAVTLPLRWLPERWIPLATNFFSAVCGALALAQLARSVALLPHDRTRPRRQHLNAKNSLLNIPLAWLPPSFAVLVCGLGLSFWEHGTNGTVEMFDLLLFSYIVRSLLEYRIDLQESRLYRAAFVFGVGITSNYAMIACFPLFIGALVWTRQLEFFNRRFLGRMALCGVAGLLLYFLLPTLGSLSQTHDLTFWQLLKGNLQFQKYLLFIFPKKLLLLLSLTSLLPLFLLAIRWASHSGETNRFGVMLTTVIFHLVHVVILLACAWMALDPEFSPRKVGFGFAFLPLYFLGALSVGYYSGYLLLVFRAQGTRLRPPTSMAVSLQYFATGFVVVLFVIVPTALLYRNFAQIRLTNGPATRQFTADLAADLPPKNGVVISDDPRRLWLLQDHLARTGRSGDFILVCSQWLPTHRYHEYLKRRYPQWVLPAKPKDTEKVPELELVGLMQQLARDHELFYLHGTFGYYLEFFADEPLGLVHRLTPFTNPQIIPAFPTAEVIARNEHFWTQAQAGAIRTILPVTRPPDPARRLTVAGRLFRAIRLKPIRNVQLSQLGTYYSRALVAWGVELQKAGAYDKSPQYFGLAQQLNPDNLVAGVNLEFNEKFRTGQPAAVESTQAIEERFGKSRLWEDAVLQYGPYDEPSLTYAQGYVFARGGLIRQAAQAFERVRALSTNDLGSRLWLAQLNLNQKLPDRTLELTREIRSSLVQVTGPATNLADLFTLEASAYYAKNEPTTASKLIESSLAQHPGNIQLLAAACRTYSDNGQYTNALDLTRRILRLTPDDPNALINQGCFQVQLGAYADAVASFNRVLTLEATNSTALFYRAIAALRGDQLDAALQDYEVLQQQFPKAHQMYYGLGEIAYRRKDTNTAILHYEAYLANSPTNNPENAFVVGRLQELKGDAPK